MQTVSLSLLDRNKWRPQEFPLAPALAVYNRADSSDHSWESKSCSGIALQFSGVQITWSWTDPARWSFGIGLGTCEGACWMSLLDINILTSCCSSPSRLFDLISLCPSVRLAFQTLVSMCQREKCSPKSQGGAHYPEWEHCKLIGFAPDQETELFPEAVTGWSTKINVPLFNTIKHDPSLPS